MRAADVLIRLVGLLCLMAKRIFSRGRVSFGATVLVSPSLKIQVARRASLVLGRRVVIAYDVDICAMQEASIAIGEGTYLGPRCMLSAHDSIRIGARCLFGPDVKIFDNNHAFKAGVGVLRGIHNSKKVVVGDNVWLGANVILLKGVKIGDGAVVGAGAVVRNDVAAGAVVRSGCPDCVSGAKAQ